MKLNKNFVVHKSGKETLLVPLGGAKFSGIVKGNNTTGKVLEMLNENTTEQKIVASLRSEFEAPECVIEKDVKNILSQLRKIGALDE